MDEIEVKKPKVEAKGAMQLSWPNGFKLALIFGCVLLTESVRGLDLIPIWLLVPWTVLAGAIVVLILILAIVVAVLKWRGWRLRYSTSTLLLLGFVVAWPLSRFAVDIHDERRRIQSQLQCFEIASKLERPARQITMSGRYNDGRADYAIQRWMMNGLSSLGSIPNQVFFELCNIDLMDLTNSSIEDSQLQLVAKTQTASELDLTSTNITDAGLAHLYELTSLRTLNLTNTSVSKPAIDALTKRLPNLVIQP